MSRPTLPLTITRLGLERFTAAQLDADIDLSIATVGITDAVFVAAPTLDALPGEFKRLATISGDQVGDNVVHMTMRDESADTYFARGIGLYLADGTLFAAYGQDARLFQKSAFATLFAAIDIGFPTGDVSQLVFGDTNFLNPPATTQTKGVARIATPAELAEGTSTDTFVTPAALLSALRAALPAGVMAPWYGDEASVPAGWAICDGRTVARSDGLGPITTPDLRDRVVVGAGTHDPGETFGAAEQTTSQAGAHAHTAQIASALAGTTLTTTSKTDTASGGTADTIQTVAVNDPGHAHNTTIEQDGAHAHTVDVTQPSRAYH